MSRREPAWVLLLVAALALPALVIGPQLMADDWVWVRNGEVLGWWDAGGARQVGRPGAFALYALTFGAIGAHPLLLALVQIGLWAAAALAVLAALDQLVERAVSFAVVLVWVLAPSHTSLELWASTSQAWVAIILLALGTRQLAVRARADRPRWLGYVLLGAAGCFYEVAIPAVPVLVVAVDLACGRGFRLRQALLGGLVVLPAALWSLMSGSVYADAPSTEDEVVRHLAGSVGMGLPADRTLLALVVVVAWLTLVVASVHRHRTGRATDHDAMVLIGAALTVAGTIPALRAYTIPVGMGDRLTAISGFGAALSWVGGALIWGVRLSRPVQRGALVAALVLAVVLRLDALATWERVGDEGVAVAARLAAATDPTIVVAGPLASEGFVYALSDGWNTTAAVQVISDDPRRVVQVDIGCVRSGPLPSDPTEQDEQRSETVIESCRRGAG